MSTVYINSVLIWIEHIAVYLDFIDLSWKYGRIKEKGADITMNTETALFHGDLVNTSRIIYTPSDFAKLSLLHLQEIGTLQATKPHISKRSNLASYLFFVVQSGSGVLIYDGISYALSPGDCVFIDCRKPYSHETSENLWNLSWVHFNGPTAANIYQKYIDRGGLPVFHPEAITRYSDVVHNLYEIAASLSYIRDMDINTNLSMLLSFLMEDCWNPEKARTGTKKTDLLEIKRYLEENYAKKVTLNELSERYFINKYYLTRVFKEQFGVSIGDYLLGIRITQAKNLLRFTNKSAEQIGQECGIGDVYYFSRVFKKVEGISVREYRKQWGA